MELVDIIAAILLGFLLGYLVGAQRYDRMWSHVMSTAMERLARRGVPRQLIATVMADMIKKKPD